MLPLETLRLDNLFKELIKKHHPELATEEERFKYIEEQAKPLVQHQAKILERPLVEQLDAFKAALGEEHYKAIAGSPNFMDVFKAWKKDLAVDAMAEIKKLLNTCLGNEPNEAELDGMVALVFVYSFTGL
jgi:hypothetical protein